MTPRNLFRSVVASSLALSVLSLGPEYFGSSIPEDWRSVLEWHGQGGIIDVLKHNVPGSRLAGIALLLLLVSIIGYVVAVQIGIFFFWPFARFGYVLVTGGFVILASFDGLSVATPWDNAIAGLGSVLDGVIITLSYLPPIRDCFERSKV